MQTIIRRTLLALSCTVFTGLLFTSCSKKENGPSLPGTAKHHYKITVTASNVENGAGGDFISIVASTATSNPNDNTLWKINGVAQTGERAVGLDQNDFSVGSTTYVIETIQPVMTIACGYTVINFDGSVDPNPNLPMPFSFKVEKDGKVELDINKTFAVDEDENKDFSF